MHTKLKKVIAIVMANLMWASLTSNFVVTNAGENDWIGDVSITENTTIADRITAELSLRLHIEEGVTLTLEKGIDVLEGSSLTVDGGGTLICQTDEEDCAGIGSSKGLDPGNIVIDDCIVFAKGGEYAAGIGGTYSTYGGDITIDGGRVEAIGGSDAAGIGCGCNGNGCNITINDGEVNASVSEGYGAAIGTGLYYDTEDSDYTIAINGGSVTAKAGDSAAAIGQGYAEVDCEGTVSINGGVVNATSDDHLTGIGSCSFTNTGTVNLSWTNDTDSIKTDAVKGQINVLKDFYILENEAVLEAGEYDGFSDIGDNTMTPYIPQEEPTTEEPTTVEPTTVEETTTEEPTTVEATTVEETTTEEPTTVEPTTVEETTTEEPTTVEPTTVGETKQEPTTVEITTVEEEILAPEGLINGVDDNPYSLQWNQVIGADYYNVYVDDVIVDETTSCNIVLDEELFKEAKTYNVSVSAVRNQKESEKTSVEIVVEEETDAPTTTCTETETTTETVTETESVDMESTSNEETTTVETTTEAITEEETSATVETSETSVETTSAEGSSERPVDIFYVEQMMQGQKSDKDLGGSKFSQLKLRSAKQTKKSIKLVWDKINGASKYVVYANKCGKSNKLKKIAELTGKNKNVKKVAGKSLKSGTYYKFVVVAIDSEGTVLSISKTIHVRPTTKKKGNYKSVQIKKLVLGKLKKLKVGKKINLKAKAKSGKLKANKHIGLRYGSMNKEVATISKKGVIKGISKGTAYMYAYAQNGVFKKIKVIVK